ncbi:MAG: hypothetical protein L0956_02930, partial [Candidatus Mariimomonas ferrooxydans]
MYSAEPLTYLLKQCPAAYILQIWINGFHLFQKFRVHISFLNSHFLEFLCNTAELYPLRADSITGVAETAKPYEVRGKHLFFHAEHDHVYQAARVKMFSTLPQPSLT